MESKPVEFHEAAGLEFEAAFTWYLERSERAALRFAREVERAVAAISDSPERSPSGPDKTRRFLLQGFPFIIFYRVLPTVVQVMAVRMPGGVPVIGERAFSACELFAALQFDQSHVV